MQVEDDAPHVLGTFDSRCLSTEVAARFSGRVVGVEATSGNVTLRTFRYTTKEDSR
ncbi:hypothetical protein PV749_01935 [Streptomyces sp. ID03-2B]|uniref:Uncharacterized protein n=1 Tax=Streptomyces caviscabies TaxID=90079 RepID=A0ABW2ME39_9ACTN|nr:MULTISPECIES: hypothetical protein [unclassified Streptomyces]MCL6289134.1 hypothetical protein [Streptomyces sp. 43Y-GA-1]MDX3339046.1 hypothetical protein [Streptomyces sp. ME02-6979.5a]MDX3506413.1 hypothetical protein [Streptomyces sp. ATCC51928]MDX3589890.1 hypothetical protein [Streptomyces sp. ID03-2B]MDX5522260.1 hypothetical protein [Streptomyces sp. DE06-01C]